MSGRGSRKRGRPPKTPNERSAGRFNYQLLKKPKYLSEGKSQPSTPSASRCISPQSDECSRSSTTNNRGSRGKRGRGRKSNVQANTSTNSYSGRKGKQNDVYKYPYNLRGGARFVGNQGKLP